ncbi:SigB/SigF/SigG family RNA polymerase sigma factor [Conexibacter stalactiti]|uniref:SigB/SigF/SigG family RNA polymerase sigma factor n=1 Tax=Conexibacter stalactiti TaxID=1940611 RepID=A0ABU4HKI5_9ACTN|nr:SigB/SigF/SigG family RNA polymerase sigma factor [Conexibacter stalactiti]MDW5593219.1 SigB/SigF/SigG family RNA polymerase sigma factor [Conexibacter stalactiti]MEC5033860.1 SigB/SigF/SigG family RNA polymerase sigma factor [Conexibacter stalactiti]
MGPATNLATKTTAAPKKRPASSLLRTRMLAARARKGDTQAREALIAEHLPLARALARRYRRGTESLDDLVQVASVGLIKAVDRFDPDRGHSFSTFAQPTIVGELLRHFRDTGWGVHVARGTQELALKVRAAAEAIETETGVSATPRQLAERTGADLEAVVEALGALANRTALSLATPAGGDDEGDATIADTLGDVEEGYRAAEARALLAPALKHLPEREQRILRMRFVDDLTQSEIATEIGVSQMQISRLLRQSLDKLHELTR